MNHSSNKCRHDPDAEPVTRGDLKRAVHAIATRLDAILAALQVHPIPHVPDHILVRFTAPQPE
jgi:hypothetical protein